MALLAIGAGLLELGEVAAVAIEGAEVAEAVEVAGTAAELGEVAESGGVLAETGAFIEEALGFGTEAAESTAALEEAAAALEQLNAFKNANPELLLEEFNAVKEGITNIDFITNSADPIAALEQMSGSIFDTMGSISEALTEGEIEGSVKAVTEGMSEAELSGFLEEMGLSDKFHAEELLGFDEQMALDKGIGEGIIDDLISQARPRVPGLQGSMTNALPSASNGISLGDEFLARTGNLSKQVSKAVYEHFGDIYDEFTSGRFVKKTIQAKILEKATGKIDTGNEDANNVLRGIGNAVSGGTAFAELSEASAFIVDSIGHLGVPIPSFIHDNFGGSAVGSAYTGVTGGVDNFIDTLNGITQNLPEGASQLLPGIEKIPKLPVLQQPTQVNQVVVDVAPPNNGRIEILSEQGNRAPVNEIIIPTATSRDPTQGRPIEGDVFAPQAIILPDENIPHKKSVSDVIVYDESGSEIPVNDHDITHITDPGQLGRDVGRLVGQSANNFSSKTSNTTGPQTVDGVHDLFLKSLNEVGFRTPSLTDLAGVVSKFLSSSPEFNTPDTDEYLNITRVYNGKNLAPDRMFRNGLNQISCRDEVGVVTSYTGGVGNIPAYDEFCGPFSPNAKFPVTLLGTFCFFHDTDYDNEGYFSKTADYKFMSRISQNLDRMGYQERIVAQITMEYFANVGVVLGALKTDFLPDNIDEIPVDTGLGGVVDIFSVLLPEQVDSNLQAQGLQKRTTTRDNARTAFYSGVRAGVENVEKRNIQDVRGGGEYPGLGNQALLESFMALTVVNV